MESTRNQVYAAPAPLWGPWATVASQIGSVHMHITVEPIPDGVVVVGEVRYYNQANEQTVQSFADSVDIDCGDSVANIDVHLQGSPTGASCWVDVS